VSVADDPGRTGPVAAVWAEDLQPVLMTPAPRPRRQRRGERQGLLFDVS
jgi:hypothetical protein